MKITFVEEDGRLLFRHSTKDGDSISNLVPREMWGKDPAFIRKFAEKRISEIITEKEMVEKEKLARVERIHNLNKEVCVKHHNKNLVGRIIYYPGDGRGRGGVTVILESPKKYSGKVDIVSCMGMGFAGIHIFEDDGHISEWTLAKAKESLVSIHRQRKIEIERKALISANQNKLKKILPKLQDL